MSNIRHKILDTLKEDWLNTQYDSAQSFYKKARTEDDGNKLYSYDTLVAEVKDGKPVIYNAQSQTTRRHIKEFLKQKGFTEDEIHKAIFDFKKSNGGWKPRVEESLKEDYPFTHDVTIYYGTNEDGSDDTGEIEIFVDNRKDFPELTDEEIHDAFKNDNLSIWFNDISSEYEMFDIKIKDGYWLMYKGCEDSGTKPHFVIEKDLTESVYDLPNVKCILAYYDSEKHNRPGSEWTIYSHYTPANTLKFVRNKEMVRPQEAKYFLVLSPSEYEDAYKEDNVLGIDKYADRVLPLNNIKESAKPDKNKKPTKRLVMNQGNVYIFEQTKGKSKSYIVGEDIDKDANTIEKVNRYKNQDEAFTDFFERVGINPNNELKENFKVYVLEKNGNEYNSVEVDEVETEEQAQDRVAELRAETGNNAYYEEKDKETIKEDSDLDEYDDTPSREYTTEDLDNLETGMPVAVELQGIGEPIIKTTLYSGKKDDKYFFFDGSGFSGMFGLSKKYIDDGKAKLSDNIDLVELATLTDELKKNNK